MTPESGYRIEMADAIDCRIEDVPWRFATEHAAAIDTAWATALARRPKMFNGRVLMLTRGAVEQRGDARVFRGAYTAVDFKAFLAWRDLGWPVRDFRNCFGMAALQAADGAFVLGEMAAHTANAGLVYFPSGTPDLDDVRDGEVDIAGSIARELREETGLGPEGLAFEPGFTLMSDPLRVCVMQRVRAAEPADQLVARIDAALGRETMPELSRMLIVRSPADFTPAMLPFVTLYMRRAFEA